MSLSKSVSIAELNARSRDIFRTIVDAFLEQGEPIGSRTISRRLETPLSPATIRNVMADLQELGLLHAPHNSAGRLPTDAGLRLFVDGLMQVGDISEQERSEIEGHIGGSGLTMNQALEQASTALAGLSSHVGLVLAPKTTSAVTHLEFVPLGDGRALVVMVDATGQVENRVINIPVGLPASALTEASNYLRARLAGKTLDNARKDIIQELADHRAQLDELTSSVVAGGLAVWSGGEKGSLIVKGQARLLDDVAAVQDLDRIKSLFDALERKETMLRLMDAADDGDGVQIFIGAENSLFNHSGWSMVLAPYGGPNAKVLGAIGVVGPTRLNYARIIPMVDYTARVIGRMLNGKSEQGS
ncbi:MAG: heat-inducible transcriptional repressor HrcA [Rhodospirillales bacterium]|jgi:heat-inducible transcriptional repressor